MVAAASSFFCVTLAVLASTVALSDNHHGGALIGPRRHAEVVRHAEDHNLTARGYQYNNMRATWYAAGLGACGITNAPSDFIVALAQNTFGFNYPSPYCNRPILISYNGQTARAVITDSCVACATHDPHALDFTESLFTHFSDIGAGVIYVDWSFTDVDDNKPTTTSHHHTTTTTTLEYVSSSKSRPTSTSISHSSEKPSSTSTTTHTSPSPTNTSSPVDGGNFYDLNEFVLRLEYLVAAAAV